MSTAFHQTSDVYSLTEEEKVWLGLKRPPVKRGNILVAIPRHYTSSSCEWHTEWISDLMLPKWRIRPTFALIATESEVRAERKKYDKWKKLRDEWREQNGMKGVEDVGKPD